MTEIDYKVIDAERESCIEAYKRTESEIQELLKFQQWLKYKIAKYVVGDVLEVTEGKRIGQRGKVVRINYDLVSGVRYVLQRMKKDGSYSSKLIGTSVLGLGEEYLRKV